MLRVVDTTGAAPAAREGGAGPDSAPAHAFLGLGFAERHQAVEFTGALSDYTR